MILLLACTSPGESAETAAPPWCSSLEDAGLAEPVRCTDADCASSSTSGRVRVWLLTDVGADPTAPEYSTYKDWTLAPAGGGVAQTGQTDGDRGMSALVGAGSWTFTSTFVRGGRTCSATQALEVVAQEQQDACAVMSCPIE